MSGQSLLLNIIPFTAPTQEKEFAFYTKRTEGYCPIHKGDLTGIIEELISEDELEDGQWLYSDFDTAKPGAVPIKVDLTKNIYFAQHYYRHLIKNYFKGVADVMRNNFTNEVEVWFHNAEVKNQNFKVYDQYTLKVQHSRVTDGPELVLSYDGKTKVYAKSLAELGSFPYEKLNWINCDGELHRFKFMPAHFKLKQDKLFPVLSNPLKPEFHIAFDVPDFKNRYPRYQKKLQHFYDTYLNTTAFKKLIPLSAGGFFRANSTSVQRINNNSNELLFGRGIGREPKTDMKRLGPYKPVPPPNNVKFFFIYQQDQKNAALQLYYHFTKGLIEGKNTFPSFPNMQEFICQPFEIEKEANIEFTSLADAITTVEKAIKNKSRLPDTKYMAIYVSPVSKLTVLNKDKHIYFRIKEILLQHQITSQFIYSNNISSSSFKYHLPNIEIAILAKLKGIPWRLNRSTTNELIVGIGAFYSNSKKTKYVGSAFCFNNEGEFQGFDCFQANETDMLAGSIRKAVLKYIVDHDKADRLIIHFYKEISKKELEPIISTLHKLGLPIPVIIVSINKTESKELLGFDTSHPELMPYSGTYVKVARQEYLLFNNTRYNETSKPSQREYHFPVKISLASSVQGLLDDTTLIEALMDQVYQFSRMYFKSVSQQSLPVTIKYPEMVAQIYPWFQSDKLPEFGRENLWFL